MRNPPAAEIFNEEVANLLKRKIHASVTGLDDLSIEFDYDGQVTAQDAAEILAKIETLYRRASQAAEAERSPTAPRRCGSSPRTSRKPSTGSNPTSSTRT